MPAKPRTIEECLEPLPPRQRAALEKLRGAIRAAAPGAEECLSYGMPAFRWQGRVLVAFGGWREHNALYPMCATVIPGLAEDLKHYDTSKGTIRFPADKTLPAALVRKIVKLRCAGITASKSKPRVARRA